MPGRLPVKIYFLFYQKNVRMANIFLREVRPNRHFAPVPPAAPGVAWFRRMARSPDQAIFPEAPEARKTGHSTRKGAGLCSPPKAWRARKNYRQNTLWGLVP